jgi:hypothetical protein
MVACATEPGLEVTMVANAVAMSSALLRPAESPKRQPQDRSFRLIPRV